jgi:S1-C subfamily serine protease
VIAKRPLHAFGLAALCGAALALASADVSPAGGPFDTAIESMQQRVVKLYGGSLGREKGYGSGIVVSADGKIVTTLSILLEGRTLRVVLPDGRRFPARITARDQRRQLALLQVDAFDLPCFELADSRHLQPGDWVMAAANPFKVADGPEPVSVSLGVLSGRTDLAARRHAQDFPYDGPVLLTDLLVATPGSAGGALVDADGNLVGLIGKAVVSKQTNTWLNYALPVEEVAAFLEESRAVPDREVPRPSPRPKPDAPRLNLGFRLFDVGGREPPPYIERVRPDSPAWRAGLRPNDLILSIDGQQVVTCADFREAANKLRPGQPIQLVIKRREEVVSLELTLEEPSP